MIRLLFLWASKKVMLKYSPLTHETWIVIMRDPANPSKKGERRRMSCRAFEAKDSSGNLLPNYFSIEYESKPNNGQLVVSSEAQAESEKCVRYGNVEAGEFINVYENNKHSHKGFWAHDDTGIEFSNGHKWIPIDVNFTPSPRPVNIKSAVGTINVSDPSLPSVPIEVQVQAQTQTQGQGQSQTQVQHSFLPAPNAHSNASYYSGPPNVLGQHEIRHSMPPPPPGPMSPPIPMPMPSPGPYPSPSPVPAPIPMPPSPVPVPPAPDCKPVLCPPQKPCPKESPFWKWLALALLLIGLISLISWILSRRNNKKEKIVKKTSKTTITSPERPSGVESKKITESHSKYSGLDTKVCFQAQDDPFYRPK